MSSIEETVARIATFYWNQAHEYHRGTYENERSESKHARLRQRYRELFAGRDVLEVACGTGYWTEVVADTASSVLATDINSNLVEITRERTGSLSNVRCEVANGYTLDTVTERFTGAFAQYWWSHVPKRQLAAFLKNLHSKLAPGAQLFFSDDLIYHWETLTRRTDEHGDIYESRPRSDGTRSETIKNFPTEGEIVALIGEYADEIHYEEYEPEHLWTLAYRLR